MATLRVGTTAFGDRSLIRSGRFYPPEANSPEKRLRFYASRFPITEIDSTYYAIPDRLVAEHWVERTPAGFVFDVKAFRLFSQHRTPLSALPVDLRADAAGKDPEADVYHDAVPEAVTAELWRRFRVLLDPLRRHRKVGVVLLQLAPWIVYGPPSLAHIERCRAALEGYEVAVEMRNKTWFSDKNRERTLAFLRALGLVHVVVDEPQGSSFSIPQVWAVTHPRLAVVRLHGRNDRTWRDPDVDSAAERFDHLYSPRELMQFVGQIEGLGKSADDVHVLFNNCHGDNAQRNAASLRRMLAARETQPLGMDPW